MKLRRTGRCFRKVSLLLSFIALSACTSGPTLLPESYLEQMASSQFTEMKTALPVSTERRHVEQVERVGRRIAAVVAEDMPGMEWEFVVFDDPSVNAFAMPGGKIGVFTGLLELAETDDELAAVIGHEIGHVQMRHSNQRMSAELIRAGIGVGVAYGASQQDAIDPALVVAAFGLGSQVGIMLPYSRFHENEADYIGLLVMARAGYDPNAAVTFWEKMQQQSGGSGAPEYLSTHPSPENRIQRIREAIPRALEEKEHAEAEAYLRERGIIENP